MPISSGINDVEARLEHVVSHRMFLIIDSLISSFFFERGAAQIGVLN